MTIFAREHEIVTCSNGHPVLEVVNDLRPVGPVRAADFRSVQVGYPDPAQGEPMRPCAECGEYFFRGRKMHFEDGWRPSQ